jgi:hypothetical protein
MLLPALSRAKMKAQRIQCMNNTKQLTLGLTMVAAANNDKLPSWKNAGNWLWDVPVTVTDQMGNEGAIRKLFYCPAFPDQNDDALWNFALPTFRVVGYAFTFDGTGASGTPILHPTNSNVSMIPSSINYGGVTYPPQPTTDRVLLADATISNGNNEANRLLNTYTGIMGGWSKPHRTPHLERRLPSGGTVGMLDGHAEWRKFPQMRVRTLSGPYFWW